MWKHLIFLTKIAKSIIEIEIENFVSNFQKTYEFLHLNLHESKDTFNNANTII